MRFVHFVVPAYVVLAPVFVKAAPQAKVPTPSTKAASGTLQASYVKRVEVISNDLKPAVANLWAIFGEMEDLNGVIQKHIRRDGNPSGADLQEWTKLKTSLAATVQTLRNNTKRLRGISPVPRSLKKIDTEFVDASFEIETGLDSLMTWVSNPSPEMNLQLGRQLRKGITTWSNAQIALGRATDPTVKAKVYVED